MECQNCGNEISNDDVFCSKCETRLDVGNVQKDMLPIDGRYGYTQTHERCWGSNSTMTPGQLGSSQGQEHDSSQDTKARAVGLCTSDDSGKDNGKEETFISEEKKELACSSSGLFLKILTVIVWATLCMDLVFMWGVLFLDSNLDYWLVVVLTFILPYLLVFFLQRGHITRYAMLFFATYLPFKYLSSLQNYFSFRNFLGLCIIIGIIHFPVLVALVCTYLKRFNSLFIGSDNEYLDYPRWRQIFYHFFALLIVSTIFFVFFAIVEMVI